MQIILIQLKPGKMLKLMYITNRPEIAQIAEQAGVDRVFVDLEVLGKSERQKDMDTVQSHHTIDDIAKIRKNFGGELLVRSNHIHEGSKEEINAIISNGADVVMLPYFKTVEQVAAFIDFVGVRAKTNLLVETAEAVEILDEILELKGIDEIHIGLNDLHLSYGMKFMFELLADGTVERVGRKIIEKGIPYGFGGIARLGYGLIPAECLIKEHYRLGSTCAILSRSFCNSDECANIASIRETFMTEVAKIRDLEREVQSHHDQNYFRSNKDYIDRAVKSIIETVDIK